MRLPRKQKKDIKGAYVRLVSATAEHLIRENTSRVIPRCDLRRIARRSFRMEPVQLVISGPHGSTTWWVGRRP